MCVYSFIVIHSSMYDSRKSFACHSILICTSNRFKLDGFEGFKAESHHIYIYMYTLFVMDVVLVNLVNQNAYSTSQSASFLSAHAKYFVVEPQLSKIRQNRVMSLTNETSLFLCRVSHSDSFEVQY